MFRIASRITRRTARVATRTVFTSTRIAVRATVTSKPSQSVPEVIVVTPKVSAATKLRLADEADALAAYINANGCDELTEAYRKRLLADIAAAKQ